MENGDLYAILTKHSRPDYDKDEVSKLIFKIIHCKCERKVSAYKYELFKRSAKLLIKAINNFYKLVETIPKDKLIHSQSDIASECWFIFDRCVTNIKVCDHKKYNFYLNTSLNRGVYRIFERNYKKHFDVLSNSEASEVLILTKRISNEVDLTDMDINNNFSAIEIEIINFKVSGEKLRVFLKKQNLSNNQYTEYLDVIKKKMTELYSDKEEDYDN